MINDFKLQLYVPSLDIKEYFGELRNKHLLSILKYITNKDYKGLAEYFNYLIYELINNKTLYHNLDSFDKLIILLQLKAININSELKFKINSNNENKLISYNIFNEIKKLIEIKFAKTKELKLDDNFLILLSIPSTLYIENFDDVFNNCIKLVKINDQTFSFDALSNDIKDKIFESISGNYMQEIFKFFEEIDKSCAGIKFLSENSYINELNALNLNFFNNSIINFIELIYSEDLKNIFELMYILTSKVKISLSEFYELIPSESMLMYSLYAKDIKHQNEELEKSTKTPGIPLKNAN